MLQILMNHKIRNAHAYVTKLLFREKSHWLIKIRFSDITNMLYNYRSSRPKLFFKNDVFKSFWNCVEVSF